MGHILGLLLGQILDLVLDSWAWVLVDILNLVLGHTLDLFLDSWTWGSSFIQDPFHF